MDYSKIQAKLDALKNNTSQKTASESNKLKFVPKEGKQVIRILPNFHLGKDVKPFLPLGFYYNFGATWLAPCQFDEPDAIADFYGVLLREANQEKDKGKSKELWIAAQQFNAKERICVPVLVRDFESEGVKWWWFSPKTYRDIEAICDDPDYGNIFDLKTGRDITVTYTPKEKTSTDFAVIDVLAKPKETPVSTDADVIEMVKNMPNIIELQVKPTYEQTKAALESFLNAKKGSTADENKPQTEQEFVDNLKQPVKVPTKSQADIDAEFDKLMNG